MVKKIITLLTTILYFNSIYAKNISLEGEWNDILKNRIPILASIDNNTISIDNISSCTYVLKVKVIKNDIIEFEKEFFITSNGNISFYLNEIDKTHIYKLEITTDKGSFLYGYFYIE